MTIHEMEIIKDGVKIVNTLFDEKVNYDQLHNYGKYYKEKIDPTVKVIIKSHKLISEYDFLRKSSELQSIKKEDIKGKNFKF